VAIFRKFVLGGVSNVFLASLAGFEEYQGPKAGYDLPVLLLCPQRRAWGRRALIRLGPGIS